MLEEDLQLKEAEIALEKTAFDRNIRNFGADLAGMAGGALSKFEKNPLISSAVAGGVLGGAGNAYAADPGERKKKFKQGLIGGALGGAITGGIASGGARNLGRYGKGISERAEALRGGKPFKGFRDVQAGEFGDLMSDTVFSETARRGGKSIAQKQKDLEDFYDIVGSKSPATAAEIKKVKAMQKELNREAKGLGGRFGALESAGIGLLGAGAGVKAKETYDDYKQGKYASYARIHQAVERIEEEKRANIFAKGLGYAAQGVGKVTALNPGVAGAAIGAGTGALAAGEGNRIKGALGGAALGAGAGVGLAKLAPQATANMQRFGSALGKAGQKTVQKAGQQGAQFSSSISPLKNVTSKNQFQFAKSNYDKVTQAGTGMSGMGAIGTGIAGVGAAGAIGGYGMRGRND
tara:strand:+ start:1002 stop:2222 length:1221 start_codon:yes stop_codon:yes gene_type:complete